MAIIATVTKKSVTEVQHKLWNVTLNMVLTDNSVEVINKDYSVKYRTGDSVAAKQSIWIAMMNADIDKYKSEQAIYDAAALATVISNINSALEV